MALLGNQIYIFFGDGAYLNLNYVKTKKFHNVFAPSMVEHNPNNNIIKNYVHIMLSWNICVQKKNCNYVLKYGIIL